MYCHDLEEYSVNKGENDDDFQLILNKLWRKTSSGEI